MLVISSHQLAKLEEQRLTTFLDRLRIDVLAFMRDAAPEVEAQEVMMRLNSALEGAQRQGFSTEVHLTRLGYLLVAFPLDFSTHSEYKWVSDILNSQATADERLDCISAALMADLS